MLENGQLIHTQCIKRDDLEVEIPEDLLLSRKQQNNILVNLWPVIP